MNSQASPLPELVRESRLQATVHGDLTTHTRPSGRRRLEIWRRKDILGHGGSGVVWMERRLKEGTLDEEDPVECRAVKRIQISGRSPAYYVRELEALQKFSSQAKVRTTLPSDRSQPRSH